MTKVAIKEANIEEAHEKVQEAAAIVSGVLMDKTIKWLADNDLDSASARMDQHLVLGLDRVGYMVGFASELVRYRSMIVPMAELTDADGKTAIVALPDAMSPDARVRRNTIMAIPSLAKEMGAVTLAVMREVWARVIKPEEGESLSEARRKLPQSLADDPESMSVVIFDLVTERFHLHITIPINEAEDRHLKLEETSIVISKCFGEPTKYTMAGPKLWPDETTPSVSELSGLSVAPM